MAAKVVSILNLKGGVGKSTIAMVLAEYLAFHFHKRVLAIDFDSQANLSTAMVRQLHIRDDLDPSGRTIYHLFRAFLDGKTSLAITDYVCPQPEWVSNIRREPKTESVTLDMVISTQAMAGLDEEMLNLWNDPSVLVSALKKLYDKDPESVARVAKGLGPVMSKAPCDTARCLDGIRLVLRDALKPSLDKYDVVIVDCPPGLSLLTSAAIVASDYWVSPIIPEPLALQGVGMVQSRISGLKSSIRWSGSILNKVIANRRTHDTESNRIYGMESRGFPAYPAGRFNPFHWWIPDSEHLRKISDFECEGLPDNFPYLGASGQFSYVHGKYAASETRLVNPIGRARDRSSEEGPVYHLAGRLERLTAEFVKTVGL